MSRRRNEAVRIGEETGKVAHPDAMIAAFWKRARFRWLSEVCDDPETTDGEARLAAKLVADLIFADTGQCAPISWAKLAEKVGKARDTVRHLVARMEARGQLTVQRGRNEHRIGLRMPGSPAASDDQSRTNLSGLPRPNDGSTRTNSTGTRTNSSDPPTPPYMDTAYISAKKAAEPISVEEERARGGIRRWLDGKSGAPIGAKPERLRAMIAAGELTPGEADKVHHASWGTGWPESGLSIPTAARSDPASKATCPRRRCAHRTIGPWPRDQRRLLRPSTRGWSTRSARITSNTTSISR